MAASGNTTKLLLDLVNGAIEEPDEEEAEISWPFKSFRLPISAGEVEQGWVHFTGEYWKTFESCLDALASEEEFKYLTRADIDHELGQFWRDCYLSRDSLQSEMERQRVVGDFLSSFVKQMDEYEVVFEIENLTMLNNPIQFAQVEIKLFSADDLNQWSLSEAPQALRELFVERLVGKAVVKVAATAASPARAAELAAEKCDTALDVLRFALGTSRFGVLEEQLMFRRGLGYATRLGGKNQLASTGLNRPFGPVLLKVNEGIRDVLDETSDKLAPLYDGTIQGKRLLDALQRSLRWIGTSVTRQHLDHKVMDLCTALEAVVTLKGDARKGEAIALRSILLALALGKPFMSPTDTYRLYDLRSDIVHGSKIDISTKSDYYFLRVLAKDVLLGIVALVKQNQNLRRPSQLIRHLESRELLEQAIGWLEGHIDDGHPVIEFARIQLTNAGTN